MMTLETGRIKGKDELSPNDLNSIRIPMPPRHPKVRQFYPTFESSTEETVAQENPDGHHHPSHTDSLSAEALVKQEIDSGPFNDQLSPVFLANFQPKDGSSNALSLGNKTTAFEDISLLNNSLDKCAIEKVPIASSLSNNIKEDPITDKEITISSVSTCEENCSNPLKHTVIINKYKAVGCSSSDSSDDKKVRPTSRRARKRLRKKPGSSSVNNQKVPFLPPPPPPKKGNTKHRRSIDIIKGERESSITIEKKLSKPNLSSIKSSVSVSTSIITASQGENCPDNVPTLPSGTKEQNMRLPGLSTKHSLSLSSDETDQSTTPYTPLLSTPDLKIELLEADEQRRLSIIGCPFFPPGFPHFSAVDMTADEIHAFDMRWGSPHHARGGKSLSRPTLLALPPTRPRMTSLPNREDYEYDEEDGCYRIRHFSITGRGVINRGDSFKSRRTRSNNSVASDVSSNEGWIWSHPCSLGNSAASSIASSRASSASEGFFPFRVVMLGGPGVGKTTLCHQFMTSEHINAYDTSLDDEYGEKSISVMLDGEESEILFVDHPADEMSVENYLATYNPHAIVLVFSVIDQQSFYRAEETLQYLWRHDVMATKGVILVANKTDLVRNRCVTQKESSSLADSYGCKFIETSSGLNHQVDELLVGVLKQIRLKIKNGELPKEGRRRKGSCRKKFRGTKTSASLKVKSLLTKVCGKEIRSKSCENLHVL